MDSNQKQIKEKIEWGKDIELSDNDINELVECLDEFIFVPNNAKIEIFDYTKLERKFRTLCITINEPANELLFVSSITEPLNTDIIKHSFECWGLYFLSFYTEEDKKDFDLNNTLQKAIKSEQYELAQMLQDHLNSIKKP